MIKLKLKTHGGLFICIILMISFTSSCSNNSTKKVNTSLDKVNSYLVKNYANVDISKDNYKNGLSIMDSDIDKNNIILVGEEHAVAKNYEIQLALLKNFNKTDKVRYLLAEIGYSSSCYINEYLDSGDEAKLKLIYNDLSQTPTWNKESYDFWIKLRKYNLTVPQNQRIKVIGIDIELQPKTACAYLNSILPSNAPPKEIQLAIDRYTDSYKIKNNSNNIITAIENLQSDIKAKPSIYSGYLGNNYFDFNIVVDNIVNSINANSSNAVNFDDIREPSIYSNFKRIYSHFPVGKYFGEFGMEHVYQKTCSSYMGNATRFAMYLNNSDSPVKGKVLSIAYGYKSCKYANSTQNYVEGKADTVISNIDILDKYSKTDITLFKLNGDNSPFNSKTYFVKGPNGGCTLDYFKYIILIKNSKGAIPLGKL